MSTCSSLLPYMNNIFYPLHFICVTFILLAVWRDKVNIVSSKDLTAILLISLVLHLSSTPAAQNGEGWLSWKEQAMLPAEERAGIPKTTVCSHYSNIYALVNALESPTLEYNSLKRKWSFPSITKPEGVAQQKLILQCTSVWMLCSSGLAVLMQWMRWVTL